MANKVTCGILDELREGEDGGEGGRYLGMLWVCLCQGEEGHTCSSASFSWYAA
jgi:hypothetical protein